MYADLAREHPAPGAAHTVLLIDGLVSINNTDAGALINTGSGRCNTGNARNNTGSSRRNTDPSKTACNDVPIEGCQKFCVRLPTAA